MDVGDDLARVRPCGQKLACELIEWKTVRAGDLDDAVQWRSDREVGQGSGDVIGGDGLYESRGKPNAVAFAGGLDDASDELEELRRAQDGVGNPRGLDQLFLRDLGAKVAALWKTVGADYRERQVVLHTGLRLGGEQVSAGGFEELQYRSIVEGQ